MNQQQNQGPGGQSQQQGDRRQALEPQRRPDPNEGVIPGHGAGTVSPPERQQEQLHDVDGPQGGRAGTGSDAERI